MRITVEIEPAFFRECDGVHNERVTLPLADRVAHPRGRGILRMASPVGPDLAPFVLALEEHESSFRRLENFKWLRKKQNARDSGWIAFQNGVVSTGLCFGTVARLCFRIFRFCPRSHWRGVFAGCRVDSLAGDAHEKFPHAGRFMRNTGRGNG